MKKSLSFRSIIGGACALLIIACSVYAPVLLQANADTSGIFVYTFEDDQEPINSSSVAADSENMTRAGDGRGIMGWTFSIASSKDDVHGKVLSTFNHSFTQKHVTSGGYRFNDKNGVYRLETDTTYVVTMDIDLRSAPKTSQYITEKKTSVLYLGYGIWDAPGNSNAFDSMSKKLFNAVTVDTDATEYTVNSSEGAFTYDVNSGWHTATFMFTTPSDFGSTFNTLGVFSECWPYTEIHIDNVSVTPVKDNSAVLVLKDELHGKDRIITGTAGSETVLPEITPENEEHLFEGWYSAEDRLDSQKITSGYTFTEGVTTLYARFNAPTSITFVNTLTKEETTVTGMPGNEISLPPNPVDSENRKYFTGWYYSEDYTEKFSEKTFGYKTLKLYSRFVSAANSGFIDFENYTKNSTETVRDSQGNLKLKYRDIFGNTMSISNQKAYTDTGYSLKFSWDSKMTVDKEDPYSYDSDGRYNQIDNKAVMEGVSLDNHTQYIVRFKYLVEKADSPVLVTVASAQQNNIWGDTVLYNSTEKAGTYLTSTEKNGSWQEGSFSFTTNYKGTGKTIFVYLNLVENKDAVVYLDNIEFIPVQPDESAITYIGGTGVATHAVKGKIGETVPDYTPVNGKHTLSGWYADSLLTEETEVPSVFPEAGATLFAKWNELPVTFEDYPFPQSYYKEDGVTQTYAFGKTTSIVKEKNIGVDDDYVLRFNYNGGTVHRYDDDGNPVYMSTRYNQPDHCATIKRKLENDTVYLITYYVKTEFARNTDYSVVFYTANPNNIWADVKRYNETNIVYEDSTKQNGWTKKTVVLKTDFASSMGNTLYLIFNVSSNSPIATASAYVDNVSVEKIEAPAVVFNLNNGRGSIIKTGNDGDKINYPASPSYFGKTFKGWYVDKNGETPFDETALKENEIYLANAVYDNAETVTYNYEKYFIGREEETGYDQMVDVYRVKKNIAYSGSYVMEFDRTRTDLGNSGGGFHIVANGSELYKIKTDRFYVIKFKYYVEKHGSRRVDVKAFAGHDTNGWDQNLISSTYSIDKNDATGVWHTGTLVLNGSKIEKTWSPYLYMMYSYGDSGIYYFDDIEITELKEGLMAYYIDNGNCKAIPEYVVGKKGQSFASQLPKNPTIENKQFLGYCVLNDKGEYEVVEKMVFTDEDPKIKARFFSLKIVQDFETNFLEEIARYPSCSLIDYSYKLYDAEKEGNSKENVTSGRYSLYRKGDNPYFANAQVLFETDQLVAGEKYTITYKVKMPSYLQTDGAIKIASNNASNFAWSTTGDYFATVAVKDLTDGNWHEISYTFIAVDNYLIFQTPGYCELYIDDITFEYVSSDTPVSKPVSFTEYIPQKRDLATGELIGVSVDYSAIDISSIIDPDLNSNGFGKSYLIIIGVSVIVLSLIAAAIIIFKKKKNKKV